MLGTMRQFASSRRVSLGRRRVVLWLALLAGILAAACGPQVAPGNNVVTDADYAACLDQIRSQALPAATVPRVTAQWLGEINLFLAAFNLLPGFPLDGGRVLRAIVWGLTQNVHTATRVASMAGAGIGILLILFGVVQFVAFRASGVQALWAVFIGWFLLSAARSALREGALRRRLSSMVVRDVTRAFTQAPFPHDAVIGEVESTVRAENAPPVWPVADAAGDVYAMVATRDIAAVPPFLRTTTRVADVAREIDPADVLEPDTPLDDALQDAQRRQRGYYVVNAGGRVAGWVFVGDLLRAGRPRGSGRRGI